MPLGAAFEHAAWASRESPTWLAHHEPSKVYLYGHCFNYQALMKPCGSWADVMMKLRNLTHHEMMGNRLEDLSLALESLETGI